MATARPTSTEAELLNAAISLKEERLEGDITKATKKTSFEVGIIVFILLTPLFFYFFERQSSIFYCNSFDNGLATKLSCAIEYGNKLPPSQFKFPYPVWEITMCLRASFSGLWSMFYLDHGTNRELIPYALQYIAINNDTRISFEGMTLAAAFSDPSKAAKILNLLYTNGGKVKQDTSVFLSLIHI